jgi:orotidine-5'-phosphate decarboxylase
MNITQIHTQIKNKKSFLCVGLDPDKNKFPIPLKNQPDAIFAFNKSIIDATEKYTIAYKPNIAFYECLGIEGWQALEKTVNYIRSNYPDVFLIADAKRGDIGNTSKMYAKTFFEYLDFDAVTVAPYMGEDSVIPFTEYKNKWVILLALTSNHGAGAFQKQKLLNGSFLFEEVIKKSQQWADSNRLMYVVGATQSEHLSLIRNIAPDNFLLVPGVGTQGGNLQDVITRGVNASGGLLINSSREIIYASANNDYQIKAAEKAKELSLEMQKYYTF